MRNSEVESPLVNHLATVVVFPKLHWQAGNWVDDVLDVTIPSASNRLVHAASSDAQAVTMTNEAFHVGVTGRDVSVILDRSDAVNPANAVVAKSFAGTTGVNSLDDVVLNSINYILLIARTFIWTEKRLGKPCAMHDFLIYWREQLLIETSSKLFKIKQFHIQLLEQI